MRERISTLGRTDVRSVSLSMSATMTRNAMLIWSGMLVWVDTHEITITRFLETASYNTQSFSPGAVAEDVNIEGERHAQRKTRVEEHDIHAQRKTCGGATLTRNAQCKHSLWHFSVIEPLLLLALQLCCQPKG